MVFASAETINRGLLIANCGEELKRKLGSVKRLLGKLRYSVGDFYGVHGAIPTARSRISKRSEVALLHY
jgi:hypothetical protein